MVILGAAAFSAFSLFISTLTKSTTTSFLLSIASWLIIFPIVGYSAPISTLGGGDVNVHSARFQWSLYLNPASDMQAGVQLLVPSSSAFDELDFAGLNPLALAPDTLWIAILALVLHIVVWYSLAVLIVRRRNFE